MKSTELFKRTIKDYLDKRAAEDELFRAAYAKENKTLDECISYIFQQVRQSGCNGFADEEIYGMAMHYYDEDDLGEISDVKCNVVVNHHVELTQEDKDAAKAEAVEQYKRDVIADIKRKEQERKQKSREAQKEQEQTQLSLF